MKRSPAAPARSIAAILKEARGAVTRVMSVVSVIIHAADHPIRTMFPVIICVIKASLLHGQLYAVCRQTDRG
jgi:hypothetical protein